MILFAAIRKNSQLNTDSANCHCNCNCIENHSTESLAIPEFLSSSVCHPLEEVHFGMYVCTCKVFVLGPTMIAA